MIASSRARLPQPANKVNKKSRFTAETRIRASAVRLTLFFGLLASLPSAFAADRSEPWAQAVLGFPKLSDPSQRQLVLLSLDGKADFRPETLYVLEPGMHEFAMGVEGTAYLNKIAYRAFTIDMKPCMSYEFIAVWSKPTLRAVRPIKRCMKAFKIEPSPSSSP